ncbi:hypothetical protein J4E08_06055 [Sagittula sp. NFXS13]|uniref:hypothetical protein n=1 Tax=Sagittula sp. NFXS13 TaxID=2819095 RepID=UPI0032DFC369
MATDAALLMTLAIFGFVSFMQIGKLMVKRVLWRELSPTVVVRRERAMRFFIIGSATVIVALGAVALGPGAVAADLLALH